MHTNGIENSVLGMIKGWTLRLPTLIKGLVKGYIPLEISSQWIIMPASFLIDNKGVIIREYYGEDEGDHLPFDEWWNTSPLVESPRTTL